MKGQQRAPYYHIARTNRRRIEFVVADFRDDRYRAQA